MRYVLLLLLIFSGFVFGQNKAIDSLKKVIETTKVDTVKGRTLCKLAKVYRTSGTLTKTPNGYSLRWARNGLQICETANDLKGCRDCLNELGIILRNTGSFNQALIHFEKALTLDRQSNDRYGEAGILMNLGNLFKLQSNYTRALDFYQKSLKIRESLNDPKGIADCLINISAIYGNRHEYETALQYLQKSTVLKTRLGDSLGIANCLINIGTIYELTGNKQFALEHYEKSLKISKSIRNSVGVANCLNNIGLILNKERKYKQAIGYFNESLRMYENMGDLYSIISVYANLSRSELHIGNFKLAKTYADSSMKTAQSVNIPECLLVACEANFRIDTTLKDWQSAFKNHILIKQYSDSLTNEAKAQEFGRLESQFEFEKQTEAKDKQLSLDAERRTRFYYLFGGIFTFVLAGAGFFYYNYRSKAKNNRILSGKNAEISSQKAELENAYEELNSTLDQVQHQNEIIQHKNLQIEDSIRYAFQIQTAILPEPGYLQTILPSHFIFYQPKDIVSGDFYQAYLINDLLYVIAADCTGHGVPGAFMSVVGTNALYNAINVLGLTDPDAILSELDRSVRRTLKQEKTSESKDGMDLALLIFSEQKQKIFFSGAGRPLYFLRDGNLTEIKGDKFPVGGSQYEHKLFTAHEIDTSKGDRFYLFTDGITDQFGGESKKKFTPKRLQEFIFNHQSVSMSEQGKLFRQTMTEWMKGHKQLDDLTLIGLEV